MDPISQASLGAVVPQALFRHQHLGKLVLCGALAGMAPDLDILISSESDPLLYLNYHRQFTHALIFMPVGALIVATPLFWFMKRALAFGAVYLACLAGYATHGLLDACTSYGTQLFWPFTDYRVSWNFVSVLDPAFTLPLLSMVVCGLIWRRRIFPLLGLTWVVAYLSFGAIQGQRVYDAGMQLTEHLGHERDMMTIKPSIANQLVWKLVYLHEDVFYVHAVRVGISEETALCGESSQADRLDLAEHFPWLLESQQKADVSRFSWFSQDYLAIDPVDANQIIDVRYSTIPNEVKPLWAIALDPNANELEHVEFVVDRSVNSASMDLFWSFLNGRGCSPLNLITSEKPAD